MSSFEGLVRPFQTRQISPPKAVPSANGQDASPVVLQIGKDSGSPKVLNTSYSLSFTTYMTKQVKEQTDTDVAFAGGAPES